MVERELVKRIFESVPDAVRIMKSGNFLYIMCKSHNTDLSRELGDELISDIAKSELAVSVALADSSAEDILRETSICYEREG
jgi:uncharacterized protein (DUF1499 family)